MNSLNYKQSQFLLDTFFKNDNYTGARNIATALLESGKCIVPGTDCIWRGGIGNFIKTEPTTEAVGCVKYVFNLDEFLESLYFKENRDFHLQKLKGEQEILNDKIKSLTNL